MSSSVPLKPRAELPEGLNKLPRFGFVRRLPATHEESLQSDVIFGVESLADLFEQVDKKLLSVSPKSASPEAQKSPSPTPQKPASA